MRIAYLTDTYQPEVNGIVTSITNFTTRLAESGHQVLIIAPKYNRKYDRPISNITIKRYPAFSFATNKNTRFAYPALMGIIRDLREFKPDIIHVQTPMSIGVTGIIAAKILGIKLIQTYHTYIPDFMFYVSPYNLLGMNKASELLTSSRVWKKIMESRIVEAFVGSGDGKEDRRGAIRGINKRLYRVRKYRGENFSDKFAWQFTRQVYRSSDVVFAPSVALKKLLTKHKIGAPCVDMSNGIEFYYFEKKKAYYIRNKIIHIGRLGFEKNVDIVIRAFAIAQKTNPSLRLDIYGEGPAKKSLVKLVRDLGVNDSVNFIGFVSRATIKAALKRYDMFVTASPMETQGLVILEAMASGLPVIGVKALAVPELVHDNKNGYLVSPGNSGQMAEAMLRFTESAAKNKEFGERSLRYAEIHDIDNCYTKLESVYKKVIAGSKF